MIYNVYSMKDNVSGEFMQPSFTKNDNLAIRDLDMAVRNNDILQVNKDDFTLYCIGTYDTETGIIEKNDTRLVIHITSLPFFNETVFYPNNEKEKK